MHPGSSTIFVRPRPVQWSAGNNSVRESQESDSIHPWGSFQRWPGCVVGESNYHLRMWARSPGIEPFSTRTDRPYDHMNHTWSVWIRIRAMAWRVRTLLWRVQGFFGRMKTLATHTHTHTALNLLSVYMSCSLCLEGLEDDFPPCGRGSAQVWSLNADD